MHCLKESLCLTGRTRMPNLISLPHHTIRQLLSTVRLLPGTAHLHPSIARRLQGTVRLLLQLTVPQTLLQAVTASLREVFSNRLQEKHVLTATRSSEETTTSAPTVTKRCGNSTFHLFKNL